MGTWRRVYNSAAKVWCVGKSASGSNEDDHHDRILREGFQSSLRDFSSPESLPRTTSWAKLSRPCGTNSVMPLKVSGTSEKRYLGAFRVCVRTPHCVVPSGLDLRETLPGTPVPGYRLSRPFGTDLRRATCGSFLPLKSLDQPGLLRHSRKPPLSVVSSPWVSRRLMGTRLKPCPSSRVFPHLKKYLRGFSSCHGEPARNAEANSAHGKMRRD